MKRTAELTDEEDGVVDGQWQGSPVATASRYPILARFGIMLACFVVFIISAIMFVPMVLPASMTVAHTEEMVSDFLGLEIKIEGDHSIRLLPSLQIIAQDVVAVTSGSISEFRVGNFEATASSLALISSSLDISALHIRDPQISITPSSNVKSEEINSDEVNRTWGGWRDFKMDAFTVSGGRLTMVSSGMSDDIVFTDITLTDVAPSSDEAVDGIAFDGKATANGEEIALHIAASNPQLLVSGNRWPITGLVTSNFISLGFTGSLAMREHLVGNGNIQINSNDIEELNRWLGTKLPARPLDRLDVLTPFELSANTLELKGIKIAAGATKADGIMKVDGLASGDARMEISIDADVIDFGDEPFAAMVHDGAMSSVPLIPGIMKVSWREALWGDQVLGLGSGSIERVAGNQALKVKLDKADALDGIVRGEMTLDNSEGMHAMHLDGTAVGISFENILSSSDQGAPPIISGKASIDLMLFSVGGNADQLFEALSGSAKLQVQNGTLGVPVMVEELNQDAESVINFATLNGTFDVAQGIATSDDLLLRAEDISLVGRGSVDMADWTIELDVGQLKSGDGEKSLQRYRLSGPVRAVEFEAIN